MNGRKLHPERAQVAQNNTWWICWNSLASPNLPKIKDRQKGLSRFEGALQKVVVPLDSPYNPKNGTLKKDNPKMFHSLHPTRGGDMLFRPSSGSTLSRAGISLGSKEFVLLPPSCDQSREALLALQTRAILYPLLRASCFATSLHNDVDIYAYMCIYIYIMYSYSCYMHSMIILCLHIMHIYTYIYIYIYICVQAGGHLCEGPLYASEPSAN